VKKTVIACLIGSLALTVGASVVAYQQYRRAQGDEAKVAQFAQADKNMRASLFGQCANGDAYDTMTRQQRLGCLALSIAFDRDAGKSEGEATQDALGLLRTDADDAQRETVRGLVHSVYTDFAQLRPAHVYGAVYGQVLIGEGLKAAFSGSSN
jgi:hypothetical protein